MRCIQQILQVPAQRMAHGASAARFPRGVTRRKQHRPGIAPNANTRTFQPQEAVQLQRNQTILQPDTPAQKANYSHKWSHPTPHEADAHTYTRMRPHAPSHQAGDHPVHAHTERPNPPKLRTQRQSGLPPRAASSRGFPAWCHCMYVNVNVENVASQAWFVTRRKQQRPGAAKIGNSTPGITGNLQAHRKKKNLIGHHARPRQP